MHSNEKNLEIPGYTLASDGKYYKYNMEIDGVYYCPGNIIIEQGVAKEIAKAEEAILCDYFKIDLKEKKIEKLIEEDDSFIDDLTDIERIEIQKNKDTKNIVIYKKTKDEKEKYVDPIIIELDKDNKIVGYINNNLKKVGDNFLQYNSSLTELNISQDQKIGNNFLKNNNSLRELNMPLVQEIGDNFLGGNNDLTELNMPLVQKIGDDFLSSNCGLTELNMPLVQKIGDSFLNWNHNLTELNMPQIEEVGKNFLSSNKKYASLSERKIQKQSCGYTGFTIRISNFIKNALKQSTTTFESVQKADRVMNIDSNTKEGEIRDE